MMLLDTLTLRARNEAMALSEDIFRDLDDIGGGIGWWSDYDLSPETRCGLSDYLIDAVNGIATHLCRADVLLQEYSRKRASDDFILRGRMRKNGGDPVARGADIAGDERSTIQRQSLVYAFFNVASSVLDTLAGTVIGVAGLDLRLVKADLAKFVPFSEDPEYPSRQIRVGKSLHTSPEAQALQLILIRAFRTSLMHAGPDGWHVWLDHKRNQLAHRGGRLQMMAFPRRGPGPDTDRFLLLDRDPDLTTVQGFLGETSTMEGMYLLEDELTTMSGLLKSLNTTVIGTIVAARGLWSDRRIQPMVLPQPAGQWHVPHDASGFEGYAPIADLFKTVNAAIVNPVDATRLKSSGALSKGG